MAPKKLSGKLRRHVADVRNELYLSPISIWEAKFALGSARYRLSIPFSQWLERAFVALPVQEASITFDVANFASTLVLPHPDPGDLFLAATAAVYGLTLATADEQLLACPAIRTISNN